jgi:hypothetical protein
MESTTEQKIEQLCKEIATATNRNLINIRVIDTELNQTQTKW